jgi:hypothetical protein
MTLFTRKWRSHTTLGFGIAIVYLDPTLLGVTIQLVLGGKYFKSMFSDIYVSSESRLTGQNCFGFF